MVLFVFQFSTVCNFGTVINFGLGTVGSKRLSGVKGLSVREN